MNDAVPVSSPLSGAPDFDALLAEGESVPVKGWDFSWFAGVRDAAGGAVRATEERPSWGYRLRLGARSATSTAQLDLQTGGGEVLSSIPSPPPLLVATESWPPNLALAATALRPLGGSVVQLNDEDPLPFDEGSFDLVSSRHPTVVLWPEIARVLRPGGSYLAQLIGEGTNRGLYEYLMGPQHHSGARSAETTRASAEAAGLEVVELRSESLRVEFFDVAAVVYFLRKVLWTVPDFTVERYRGRLLDLHEQIRRDGSFVCFSQRMLIDARKRG
jgi:SAM-dependent methyltransferase